MNMVDCYSSLLVNKAMMAFVLCVETGVDNAKSEERGRTHLTEGTYQIVVGVTLPYCGLSSFPMKFIEI